jgi:hypothetical protein
LLLLQDWPAEERSQPDFAFQTGARDELYLAWKAQRLHPPDWGVVLKGFSRDVENRRVEVLMENLTAAWLGLFFLGVPMIQPWDGVRRLADQGGGYPSGGCIYKYFGDIYRTARQHVVREKGILNEQERIADLEKKPVYVLTYRPLALLEDDIARVPIASLTPAVLQLLGQRYAVLQMRLYTKQDFPIHYIVPDRALGRSIYHMLRNPDAYGDEKRKTTR